MTPEHVLYIILLIIALGLWLGSPPTPPPDWTPA